MADLSSKPAKRAVSSSAHGARFAGGGQDQAILTPARGRRPSPHEPWSTAERFERAPARWPRHRTIAFIAVTCGGFWTAVILGAVRLAH